MTELIQSNNETLAIIIYSTFKEDGIHFFTPPESSLQLGYMNRPVGYKVAPHSHPDFTRKVYTSEEVLFIKTGQIIVSVYDQENRLNAQRILSAGDCILFICGGHGIEVIEHAEILEVKQGPYRPDDHKVLLKTKTKTAVSS